MQDRRSCNPSVRALANFSGVITGLMMILVGGMIPSGILLPGTHSIVNVATLPASLQVPALLLCSLICGPNIGVISAVAYITTGLFYLPAFHNGGSIDYIFSPNFGYLIGFIPAAWVTGWLSLKFKRKNLYELTFCTIVGLLILQASGVLYLIIGSLIGRWPEKLPEFIYSYTLAPLPTLILLAPGTAMVSLIFRRILLIK